MYVASAKPALARKESFELRKAIKKQSEQVEPHRGSVTGMTLILQMRKLKDSSTRPES